MKLEGYLHFGIGDLWEAREFLKDWMAACKVTECTFACRYPAVFEDMQNVHCIELRDDHQMRKAWYRKGDTLYVNFWIGCRNAETRPSGDFVIWPGIGCVVENLFRMHSIYLREAGFKALQRPVIDYIPTVDYEKVNKGNVNDFVFSQKKRTKLVLVCNGPTGSGHAANFDMAKMVELLPESNTIFIFTERAVCNRPLVYFTDDITERNGRCDVLAISYLSTFCDVIVGRCSGAQMVCETRENWMDPSKTILSFTQHDNGATFVRDPVALGLKMRRVHSSASTPEEAAEVLKSIL